MGITINHTMTLQKVNVKNALDQAEALANVLKKEARKLFIGFEINRHADNILYIDVEGCETLNFSFYTVKELKEDLGKDPMENGTWNDKAWNAWCYTQDNKGQLPYAGYEIERFPQNELAYSRGFTKTQFGKSVFCHLWIAEIIRKVAGYCLEIKINDEGDYYHSGKIENASESIESLGEVINSIGKTLSKSFGNDNVIKGGETTIKNTIKHHPKCK